MRPSIRPLRSLLATSSLLLLAALISCGDGKPSRKDRHHDDHASVDARTRYLVYDDAVLHGELADRVTHRPFVNAGERHEFFHGASFGGRGVRSCQRL